MPYLLTRDCPHCGTRSVAFRCVGKHLEPRVPNENRRLSLLLVCGNCDAGALARCIATQGYLEASYNQFDRADAFDSFHPQNLRVESFYPDTAVKGAPPHTPPRVADLHNQAVTSLANRNWDAAGAMARKTLDVATKVLARGKLPAAESEALVALWLKKRIERLAELSLLTNDISNLAILIKDGGDDASHDEDPYTEDEAGRLIEFTQVLLTYVFTIPGMVQLAAPPDSFAESA